jgi:peptide/nickel transport system substrate-binding protein
MTESTHGEKRHGRADQRRATRRRVSSALLAAVAVMAMLGAGCSQSSTSTEPPNITSATIRDEGPPVDGGSATIGVPAETPGWNPHDDQWPGWSSFVGGSVMEPLATIDRDLNPIPWLAASWSPNATFGSYTIKLRDNVQFQDGEKLDAAAVKLNFDDIKTGALTGTVMKPLLGDITVIDPLTVQINLNQSWAAFPNTILAAPTYVIMAPTMLNSPDRGKEHPIGTGPFVFKSWTKDSTFTTAKNPSYWQKGKPHLDELNFTVLGDPSAQSAALKAGNVNMIYTSSYQVATNLEGQGFTIIKDWQSSPGMAMVNTSADIAGTPNPLSNLHARMALAYATDQQALADSVGDGIRLPKSPLSNATKWGVPDDQTGYPAFNLDKAKEQVGLYEKDTGAASLAIELSSPSDPDNLLVAQGLQAQWRQAGIDVSIATKEAGAFIADVVVGKYQVSLFSMYNSSDPDYFYYFWTSANVHPYGQISINFTRFTRPQMEDDLNVGRKNPDFNARKQAYTDIVKQINANAVNIWTFYSPVSLIAEQNLHGLQTPSQVPITSAPFVWTADLWLTK